MEVPGKPTRDLIETGMEPEYTIQALCRFEPVGNHSVRLYFASQRGDYYRLEFTCVCPVELLAIMARQCSGIAADSHNLLEWQDFLGRLAN